ncbi:MAG: transcription antitermination factor NusB [Bryobacteraceae bacterium]
MAAVAPARDISFRTLQKVNTGAFASDLLRQLCAPLDARDAALAESIVFGCLRFQAQLDFLIGHYSGKPKQKLDDEVRIALRMGIYQLRYLERIPPHAAVAESVELVKKAGKRSASGFVNAILRKVNRNAVPWPDRATELSIPAWMLSHWEQAYGTAAAEGIAKAALEEPESSLNEATGRQQDIGAQSIVPLLDIEPGMTVLDLCAAPGNKTAQAIAAGGRVIAADRVWKRLLSVPAEAARVVLDAAAPLPFRAKFDRILVDAPCSGTGTLARNPEIKWRLTPEDLPRYQARQRAILKNALASLAPGGHLVYSTCSLEPEENETVVAGCAVQKTSLRLPGRDAGDGFFAAVITP